MPGLPPVRLRLQNPSSLRTTTTFSQRAVGHRPVISPCLNSSITPPCSRAAHSAHPTTPTPFPITMNTNTNTNTPAKSRRHRSIPAHGAPQFPTHFLALPLVNAASLPQLARSVARFQTATTAPRELRPSEVQRRERERARDGVVAEGGGDDGHDGQGSRGEGEGGDVVDGGEEGEGKGEVEVEVEMLRIIPEKAQRPAGTLHLTLGTMVLREPEDFARALEVLREIDYGALLKEVVGVTKKPSGRGIGKKSMGKVAADAGDADSADQRQTDMFDHDGGDASAMDAGEEVAFSLRTFTRPVSPPRTTPTTAAHKEPHPSAGISISLRGLGTFPSPKKARVFYAIPHSHDNELQLFAEAIQKGFLDAGVLKKEDRPLTLHATVANLKYSKGSWGKGRGPWHSGKRKPAMEVDARELVARFAHVQGAEGRGEGEGEGPFVWAEGVLVDRVRICKMGAVPSEDSVMGLEYPAIWIPQEVRENGEKELAEVEFS